MYKKWKSPIIECSSSRERKREQTIWQRRFWEHRIRDQKDFFNHMDYIHYNPVKHGHTASPKDWKWSTFKKYVEQGWYEMNWGECMPSDLMEKCTGE